MTGVRRLELVPDPEPGNFPFLTEGELLQKTQRDPRGQYGLDRLALSFPLRREPDHTLFSSIGVRQGPASEAGQYRSEATLGVSLDWQTRERTTKESKAAVFVGATEVGGRWWGKVEFNPSRMVDPDGCELAPVEGIEVYATEAVRLADQLLARDDDLQAARVRRLDVARDFAGIRNVGMYVRGLQPLKRPYARISQLYSDPAAGDAQTLFVGSGAGGVRLYDQHAAYSEKGAEEGSLRWELQARSEWVARVMHSDHLGRMTPDGILDLAQQRWEWSRMGTVVTDAVDAVSAIDAIICRHPKAPRGKKICGCDGISEPQADRILGNLVRESMGIRIKQSTHAASSYEKVKRRLGLVPSAELFTGAVHFNVRGRLDWETGTEVAA